MMPNKEKITLLEARRLGKLDQFIKEHPSEGDAETFDKLLEAMAGEKPAAEDQTSTEGSSED